jgi:hypothetical protein
VACGITVERIREAGYQRVSRVRTVVVSLIVFNNVGATRQWYACQAAAVPASGRGVELDYAASAGIVIETGVVGVVGIVKSLRLVAGDDDQWIYDARSVVAMADESS